MAHFAKLGIDNVVLEVLVVNNVDTMTPQGVETESIGIAFLQKLTGHASWKQTSYNSNFRKRFAGIGYTYSTQYDAFIPPQPYESWIFNIETLDWGAPTPQPDDGQPYSWNEDTQSWDQISQPE